MAEPRRMTDEEWAEQKGRHVERMMQRQQARKAEAQNQHDPKVERQGGDQIGLTRDDMEIFGIL